MSDDNVVPMTGGGCLFLVVLLVFITLIFANSLWVGHKHETECESLGGQYVSDTRGADLCIRDGLVIKVYQ